MAVEIVGQTFEILTWWVSTIVRCKRENCDQVLVSIGFGPVMCPKCGIGYRPRLAVINAPEGNVAASVVVDQFIVTGKAVIQ